MRSAHAPLAGIGHVEIASTSVRARVAMLGLVYGPIYERRILGSRVTYVFRVGRRPRASIAESCSGAVGPPGAPRR